MIMSTDGSTFRHWYIPRKSDWVANFIWNPHWTQKIASGYAFHFLTKAVHTVQMCPLKKSFIFFLLCSNIESGRDEEAQKERSLTLTVWTACLQYILFPPTPENYVFIALLKRLEFWELGILFFLNHLPTPI